MGTSPCFNYRRVSPNEVPQIIVVPQNSVIFNSTKFRTPISRSEIGLGEKSNRKIQNTKSFYNKNYFDELTEKDFMDSYFPAYGEHNEITDKSYFSEEEMQYYSKLYQLKEKKSPNKTVKQKIRFTKGEMIGKGAFGVVFLGFNKDNGQLMAIKEIAIKSNSNLSKEMKKKLGDEIEILKDLSHENVVRFIGSQKTFRSFLLFFEYIAGGTLSSLISKFGKLNESLVKKYCKQILEGLQYLHLKGVIHSDIKGANILVDKNGVCKLTDFGSAIKVFHNSSEKDVQISGTANWMAPEVIRQEGYGRSADIWSFGCTVLEMITGKLPWSEYNNPYSIMFHVAKGYATPQYPEECSLVLQDFIGKHNPFERYNCFKLLRHEFLSSNYIPKVSTMQKIQK